MANIALILAGGTGSRMGGEIPKQFLPLANGREIITMSIDAFAYHSQIDRILVVCHKDYLSVLGYLIQTQHYQTPVCVIAGGDSRQESSLIGLCKLKKECCCEDIILIHDAARPLVTETIICDNITSALKNSACTTAIPVQDSILLSEDGKTASAIPDRSVLYAVQTPQSFRLDRIFKAHQSVQEGATFTDDAGILLSQGIPVALVKGDKRNIKITSAEDIKIANSLL